MARYGQVEWSAIDTHTKRPGNQPTKESGSANDQGSLGCHVMGVGLERNGARRGRVCNGQRQ